MSEIITSAPPAAPLVITAANSYGMFRAKDKIPGIPTDLCILPLSGSSNFNLMPFNVMVTGSVKTSVACNINLRLYAGTTLDNIVTLATSVAEPVGGASDPPQTMWMFEGVNLMFYTVSGKLQGTFQTNIADTPTTPVDLSSNFSDILPGTDPAVIFAFGAAASVATVPAPVTLEIARFQLEG